MDIGQMAARGMVIAACAGIGVLVARWKGLNSPLNRGLYAGFAALLTPLIPLMFLASNGPEKERYRPRWALPLILVFWVVYLLLFSVVVMGAFLERTPVSRLPSWARAEVPACSSQRSLDLIRGRAGEIPGVRTRGLTVESVFPQETSRTATEVRCTGQIRFSDGQVLQVYYRNFLDDAAREYRMELQGRPFDAPTPSTTPSMQPVAPAGPSIRT